MLRLLEANEVSRAWDSLSPIVEASLPPIASKSSNRMNSILSMILKGKMWVWLVIEDKTHAVITAGVVGDPYSGARNFMIYSVRVIRPLTKAMWGETVLALRGFARDRQGCTRLVFFTKSEKLVKFLKNLKSTEIQTFVSVEV